jgi:hypothetical protein
MKKDPKHDNKADNEIIWEEQHKSFLPEDMKDDQLAAKLKLLAGIVKEDHARYGYKKELKHYAHLFTDIMRFARSQGYQDISVVRIDEKDEKSEDESKWDNIVDG